MNGSRETGFRDYYMNKAAASGSRPERNRRHPKQPSFFDRIGQSISGGVERAKEYFPGSLGIAQRGVDAVLRNRQMYDQNKAYFGGNWLDDRIPNRVKESLMTPRDETFFNKYTRLAELTSDPDKRQQYIDTANTARQNMQITGRMNFGLGQIDPEGTYTNREGLASYSQDLFGEGFNRFNLDRFKEAMGMGDGILGGLDISDRDPDTLDSYEKETFGIDEKTREEKTREEKTRKEKTDEEKIQELVDEKQRQIDNFETNTATELLDDMAKDQWPPSGYRFEFDDYVQDRMDALRNAPPDDIEPLPLDERREDFREDFIRGQNEYVPPVIEELGIPNPQGGFASFNKYPYPEIGIEFRESVIPPIIPFNDVGRETGIASMYGQGPQWGETNRRYEDEYRDHIERTGERMTYEEFERAWERLHSLPRGLHYQEPRAGIR